MRALAATGWHVGVGLPESRGMVTASLPRLDDGRAGVRFSWLAGDLRRAVAERRGGLVGDLAATLNWARRAEASSVWDRHDARPALYVLLAAIAGRVAPLRANRTTIGATALAPAPIKNGPPV